MNRPGFVFGLSLPFRAAGVIAGNPRVLGLALIPFFLGIGLTVWLGAELKDLLTGQATSLLARFGFDGGGLLGGIVSFFAGLLSVLAAALLMPFVNALAAVPVNDFLAEAVEPLADPPLAPAPSPNMGQRLSLIWMDLAKTLVALLITVPVLLFSFVPGAQIVTLPTLWLLYAFGMLSYPQTRRAEGLGAAFSFVRAHAGACLGFGLMHAFIALLPLIGHVGTPLAVVGGTLLYARARGATPS